MKTTLNINVEILEKIAYAARICNVSRSKIITDLIKMVMDEILSHRCIGKMVKYQGKSSPESWHRFHIKLNEDEYEYFLDLRKVLKMSVSLIVAYAVKKYLNKKLKKSGDNNRYKNYCMSLSIVNGLKIWKFIWGMPPEIGQCI